MDIDHYFDISGINADHGLHRRICFHSPITKPTAVVDRGFLYLKDAASKAELHWEDEDGNELQVTGAGVLFNAVLKTLYDANTILAANTDNTPAALTIAEQRIVGRITGGNIIGLTGAEVLAVLNTTASRILGQAAAGATTALTAAEIRTILATAPFVVGSDADGDIWYRASGALARLAKGTASQLLRMNAGATAPEWATFQVGQCVACEPTFSEVGTTNTSYTTAYTTNVWIPVGATYMRFAAWIHGQGLAGRGVTARANIGAGYTGEAYTFSTPYVWIGSSTGMDVSAIAGTLAEVNIQTKADHASYEGFVKGAVFYVHSS